MKIKKQSANVIAKIAKTAAKEASGTASWFGAHQFKEPKNLKELIKK